MSQICELQKLIGHDLEIAKEQKDGCPGKVDNTLDRQTRFLLLNGMLQTFFPESGESNANQP